MHAVRGSFGAWAGDSIYGRRKNVLMQFGSVIGDAYDTCTRSCRGWRKSELTLSYAESVLHGALNQSST